MADETITSRVDALRGRASDQAQAGDLSSALALYEEALALAPLDVELLADLAELAGRMGLHETAMGVWGRLLEIEPDRLQAFDGFAQALRDQHRYDEAIAVLQGVIPDHQGDGRLWNTLGTVLNQSGRTEDAIGFFREAARLDPRSAIARYNLAGALFDLGDLEAAGADLRAARGLAKDPRHRAMIDFAGALLHLSMGEIARGWDAYRTRHSPAYAGYVEFEGAGRIWTPEQALGGKRVLVIGEQGLGDEVMFASMLPDLLDTVGPTGSVTIAVEPRLVSLFARSFPTARVVPHVTERSMGRPRRSAPEAGDADLWTPMADLALAFRGGLADFARPPAYLRPEPARIAHWRQWLGPAPALGLSWRSGKLTGERRRHFPGIEALTPLLTLPGVRLVNLQYDVDEAELEAISAIAGQPLLAPPGLDIRNDLDDLAALCVALPAIVGVSNATAQIAGASGANIAIISGPHSWPRLGTTAYPWYPQAAGFSAPTPGAWAEPIAQAANWLKSS